MARLFMAAASAAILLTFLSAGPVLGECEGQALPDIIVDLQGTAVQVQTAALFCQGIYNREPVMGTGGGVYTILNNPDDQFWLNWTASSNPNSANASLPKPISANQFLGMCFSWPRITGYVSYNWEAQRAVFPMIVTAASAIGAVPIDDTTTSINKGSLTLQLNATQAFNVTPAEAVKMIHTRYVNQTSGLAMMAVGYDQQTKSGLGPIDPPLTGQPNPGLIDLIVAKKLFNMYLYYGCIPLTEDYEVLGTVVSENPWPRPISVFGYNSAFQVFGGDLFEAETSCQHAHNMGQIASDGCNDLSFFALGKPITEPIRQTPTLPSNDGQPGSPKYQYNSSRTYINLFIGDGDNLNYLKGGRMNWMEQRLSKCLAHQEEQRRLGMEDHSCTGPCFPLDWSLSPHTFQYAPTWLDWYRTQVNKTGCDWFGLPPSGWLYAYPAMMPTNGNAGESLINNNYSPDWTNDQRLEEIAALQATGDVRKSFVRMTERAAWLMNTSLTTEWEWFTGWGTALKEYYPLYEERSIVRAFSTVNVPFLFPVLEFIDKQYYLYRNDTIQAADDTLVVFAPEEWRGSQNTTDPFSKPMLLSAKELAAELNGKAALGSVRSIYITSDGGANMDLIYSMVELLEEHVQVVDHEAIAAMARLRGGN